jgi:hypothetical protein
MNTRDKIAQKIAYLLPKRVVYWVLIRAGAYASTGKYFTQIIPELTIMDTIQRWDDQ